MPERLEARQVRNKMLSAFDVLIAGSGHAGAQAAICLRQNGFSGSIAICGREEAPPYERPPLTKEYLAQKRPFERIQLRPAKFWVEKDIALKLGCEVVGVDAEGKTVQLASGEQFSYDKLIWAAGGRPRALECAGNELGGIYTIRNKTDVDKIVAELGGAVRRIGVVGGGYIGLEAAASLRGLGHEVTLAAAGPRLLSRVAGTAISDFLATEHRKQGVDLRLETKVTAIEGVGNKVSRICLDRGDRVACDFLIVGIGITPEVEVLADAGAECGNGVRVDPFCRTSLPNIYAIGDCAEHANPHADGARIRLESVQNANDMAATAARHICGKGQPYCALPWFWSNQFGLRLQTAGLSSSHDQTVTRGCPSESSFSVIYLKQDRVIAIDSVNAMKDYVQGRKLIEARAKLRAEDLADTARQLKELV